MLRFKELRINQFVYRLNDSRIEMLKITGKKIVQQENLIIDSGMIDYKTIHSIELLSDGIIVSMVAGDLGDFTDIYESIEDLFKNLINNIKGVEDGD